MHHPKQHESVITVNGYKVPYKTPYYQMVLKKLREIAAHRGMIGQSELAAEMGVNRTKSFYRALTQAEIDGYVTKAGYLSEKGGRCIGYEVHVDMIQLRLPFEQEYPF